MKKDVEISRTSTGLKTEVGLNRGLERGQGGPTEENLQVVHVGWVEGYVGKIGGGRGGGHWGRDYRGEKKTFQHLFGEIEGKNSCRPGRLKCEWFRITKVVMTEVPSG